MQGEMITEMLPFDGGRRVTAFVPLEPAEALVFATDGQIIPRWAREMGDEGTLPTMLVGVHRLTNENARLKEYSLGLGSDRFAPHEQFFVQEVRAWTRDRFGVHFAADRTAVYGTSAGGEFALAMGLRHPDIYGAVFSASPGAGYRPPDVMPSVLPRVYLLAGSQEPFFLENATRWSVALRDAGADVLLGSGLVDHSQKITVAARAMAEKKVVGQRS